MVALPICCFGTTADGTIWAFNTNGIKQPIFPGFSASVRSTTAGLNPDFFSSVQGIDFSPLDVNLWHQTTRRQGDIGHGRPNPFDNSQGGDLQGGNSLYFGYEANAQLGSWQGVYNVPAFEGTYNMLVERTARSSASDRSARLQRRRSADAVLQLLPRNRKRQQ